MDEEYLYEYTIAEDDHFTETIKIKALAVHTSEIIFDDTIDKYLEHFQVTRE